MNYFDYAATCPLDQEAANVYVKASTEYFGNSQSLHDMGSKSRDLLENCRKELGTLLGVHKEGLYFTSGGSESNYLAIHALLSAAQKKGKHIIAGMTEHSSIHNLLEKLKLEGYEVTYIPFTKDGMIDLDLLKKSIKEETIFITIQHANPEIGMIQPLEQVHALCKDHKILFHSDCVHSFGKLPLENISHLLDSFSISGHKVYGPKGVGAVYVNPKLNWKSSYPGTSHERGFRPGTVNVPAVAAMTVATQKSYKLMDQHLHHYKELRNKLLAMLEPYREEIVLYDGLEDLQLPSTLGLRIKGLEGQYVMLECNRHGYAISTGSACSVGMQTPSRTMAALNIDNKQAKEFIRVSFGWDTTLEQVEGLGKTLIDIINKNK
ncbi:IscS subfamily cysteine desulfurase [Cytobacillus sp. FJAT-54145]|uniref:IscS subfamily cysteine desulfurase n=1 Tax=Cytobacillus spartinae TaxID=3299023 RepID=A0ABW6KKV5_9BACI